MRPMFLASAIALTATAGAANPPAQPARNMPVHNPDAPTGKACPPTSRYEAARRGGKLKPDLLNQLPAADMYKAVYRRIDGCNVPIIAGYGIGAH